MKPGATVAAPLTPRTATTSGTPPGVLRPQMASEGPLAEEREISQQSEQVIPRTTFPHLARSAAPATPTCTHTQACAEMQPQHCSQTPQQTNTTRATSRAPHVRAKHGCMATLLAARLLGVFRSARAGVAALRVGAVRPALAIGAGATSLRGCGSVPR